MEVAAPDDVAAGGDAVVEMLPHAGTMPASIVAATMLTTAITRFVIRGTPSAVVSSVP
ncbi:MAG TPA: hypothetical protein VG327_20585 [Mycobacterium sp.]|nr:hypothetical protein [Mycobacterium sp.]